MTYYLLAGFKDQIETAKNFWEKIQIFWANYKVWVLVGLVVLVGIIFFVHLMEAKARRDDRRDKRK